MALRLCDRLEQDNKFGAVLFLSSPSTVQLGAATTAVQTVFPSLIPNASQYLTSWNSSILMLFPPDLSLGFVDAFSEALPSLAAAFTAGTLLQNCCEFGFVAANITRQLANCGSAGSVQLTAERQYEPHPALSAARYLENTASIIAFIFACVLLMVILLLSIWLMLARRKRSQIIPVVGDEEQNTSEIELFKTPRAYVGEEGQEAQTLVSSSLFLSALSVLLVALTLSLLIVFSSPDYKEADVSAVFSGFELSECSNSTLFPTPSARAFVEADGKCHRLQGEHLGIPLYASVVCFSSEITFLSLGADEEKCAAAQPVVLSESVCNRFPFDEVDNLFEAFLPYFEVACVSTADAKRSIYYDANLPVEILAVEVASSRDYTGGNQCAERVEEDELLWRNGSSFVTDCVGNNQSLKELTDNPDFLTLAVSVGNISSFSGVAFAAVDSLFQVNGPNSVKMLPVFSLQEALVGAAPITDGGFSVLVSLFLFHNEKSIELAFSDGGHVHKVAWSSPIVFDGHKHHIAVTPADPVDGSQFRLFIDGHSSFSAGNHRCFDSAPPLTSRSGHSPVMVAFHEAGAKVAPTISLVRDATVVGDVMLFSKILYTDEVASLAEASKSSVSSVGVPVAIVGLCLVFVFILLFIFVHDPDQRNQYPMRNEIEVVLGTGKPATKPGRDITTVGADIGTKMAGGFAAAPPPVDQGPKGSEVVEDIGKRVMVVALEALSAIQFLEVLAVGFVVVPVDYAFLLKYITFIPSFDFLHLFALPDLLTAALHVLILCFAVPLLWVLAHYDAKKFEQTGVPALRKSLNPLLQSSVAFPRKYLMFGVEHEEKMDRSDNVSGVLKEEAKARYETQEAHFCVEPSEMYILSCKGEALPMSSEDILRVAAGFELNDRIAKNNDAAEISEIVLAVSSNQDDEHSRLRIEDKSGTIEVGTSCDGSVFISKDCSMAWKAHLANDENQEQESREEIVSYTVASIVCPVHLTELIRNNESHLRVSRESQERGFENPFQCVHKPYPFWRLREKNPCMTSTGFFVCPEDGCLFTVCGNCNSNAPFFFKQIRSRVRSKLHEWKNATIVLGYLALFIVQVVFVPLIQKSVAVIACHPSVQCLFPSCYNEIDLPFAGAVALSAVALAVCVIVVPLILFYYIAKRKVTILEQVLGQTNASVWAPLDDNCWKQIVLFDTSLLRPAYAPFEFRFMCFLPLLLVAKSLLTCVVSATTPDSIEQYIGCLCVVLATTGATAVTNPYLDNLMDITVKVGLLLQLGLISLQLLYRTINERVVSYVMQACVVFYLAFCIVVFLTLFVAWIRNKRKNLLQLGLHSYILQQDTDSLQFAAKHCPEAIEVVDDSHRTPLHLAAEKGLKVWEPIVSALQQFPNLEKTRLIPDRQGEFAFRRVIADIINDEHVEEKEQVWTQVLDVVIPQTGNIVELLREGGRKLPIHLASEKGNAKAIQLLFNAIPALKRAVNDSSLDVNDQVDILKDDRGQLPMHYASKQGHVEALEALFENICSFHLIKSAETLRLTKDNVGQLPLHHAAKQGHVRAVQVLLSSVPAYRCLEAKEDLMMMKDSSGKLPIDYAAENGHDEIVAMILQTIPAFRLLTTKEDLELIRTARQLPLHSAAKNGHAKTLQSLLEYIPAFSEITEQEDLQFLLDSSGKLPLQTAIEEGNNSAAVKVLIQHIAAFRDLDSVDLLRSLLLSATMNGDSDTVEVLVQEIPAYNTSFNTEADLELLNDATGKSPLDYASEHGHANVLVSLLDGIPAFSAAMDAVSLRIGYDKLPLHLAAANGHKEVLKYLVGRIEVFQTSTDELCLLQDMNGRFPIHDAAENGHVDALRVLLEDVPGFSQIASAEEVELLKDGSGKLPLHYAAENGHAECVQLILESIPAFSAINLEEDEDLNVLSDFEGKSPIQCAIEKQHVDVIQVFERFFGKVEQRKPEEQMEEECAYEDLKPFDSVKENTTEGRLPTNEEYCEDPNSGGQNADEDFEFPQGFTEDIIGGDDTTEQESDVAEFSALTSERCFAILLLCDERHVCGPALFWDLVMSGQISNCPHRLWPQSLYDESYAGKWPIRTTTQLFLCASRDVPPITPNAAATLIKLLPRSSYPLALLALCATNSSQALQFIVERHNFDVWESLDGFFKWIANSQVEVTPHSHTHWDLRDDFIIQLTVVSNRICALVQGTPNESEACDKYKALFRQLSDSCNSEKLHVSPMLCAAVASSTLVADLTPTFLPLKEQLSIGNSTLLKSLLEVPPVGDQVLRVRNLQKAFKYVAAFNEIATVDDLPLLNEICGKLPLPELVRTGQNEMLREIFEGFPVFGTLTSRNDLERLIRLFGELPISQLAQKGHANTITLLLRSIPAVGEYGSTKDDLKWLNARAMPTENASHKSKLPAKQSNSFEQELNNDLQRNKKVFEKERAAITGKQQLELRKFAQKHPYKKRDTDEQKKSIEERHREEMAETEEKFSRQQQARQDSWEFNQQLIHRSRREALNEQKRERVVAQAPLHFAVENNFKEALHATFHGFPVFRSLDKTEFKLLANQRGQTPFTLAAKNGNVETLRIILQSVGFWKTLNKSDLALIRDASGRLPLHYVSLTGNVEAAAVILQELPVFGLLSDENDVQLLKDNFGQLPLHCAARARSSGVVKLLGEMIPALRLVKSASFKDKEGQHPLHIAARNGEPETIRALLSSPFEQFENNPSTVAALKDNRGRLPLHYTVESCDDTATRALIDTLPTLVNVIDIALLKDIAGQLPLHCAAKMLNLPSIKLLGERIPCLRFAPVQALKDKQGQLPLHIAALEGSAETLRLLLRAPFFDLQSGVKLCANQFKDNNGRLPFHNAAMHGFSEACQVFLEQVDIVECRDNFGELPLHFSARNGHLDATRAILKKSHSLQHVSAEGASKLENNNGQLPTHAAASQGHTDVLEEIEAHIFALITAPSELRLYVQHSRDKLGQLPLHMAAQNGHASTVKWQLQMMFSSSAKHMLPEEIIGMLRDESGNTPWHLAAKNGHTSVLQELSIGIDCVAAMNIAQLSLFRNNFGKTPLHLAAEFCHTDALKLVISHLVPQNTVKTNSLDARFDLLTMKDNEGRLSLHHAAIGGSATCVRILLRSMVITPEMLAALFDKHHMLPLHYAAQKGHTEAAFALAKGIPQMAHMLDDNAEISVLFECAVGRDLSKYVQSEMAARRFKIEASGRKGRSVAAKAIELQNHCAKLLREEVAMQEAQMAEEKAKRSKIQHIH